MEKAFPALPDRSVSHAPTDLEPTIPRRLKRERNGTRRGKLRRQEIEIYYSFVGKVELPES